MKNNKSEKKANPLVSILCITYNHKDYIKQCLDGFVMQKTNFNFIAYVGDDCSTDGTTEIIKEYEQKYPHIIKGIYHTINTGGRDNFFDVANACKSKYVAWCEGDDYWIDEYKLQKQVDFLESHTEYAICFNRALVVYEGFNFKKTDELYPTKRAMRKGFTLGTLLMGNFMATNSVMYRWEFKDKYIKEHFPKNIITGDWYLHLLHAKCGKIKMLSKVMSVYRRNPGGIWSDSITNMDKIYLKYGYEIIVFYDCVYKNITNLSQEYLQTMLLPRLKEVTDAYYYNKNFKELQELYEKYPNYIDIALSNQKLQINKFEKKYKKYRKRFKVGLIIILMETLLIFILLNFCMIY